MQRRCCVMVEVGEDVAIDRGILSSSSNHIATQRGRHCQGWTLPHERHVDDPSLHVDNSTLSHDRPIKASTSNISKPGAPGHPFAAKYHHSCRSPGKEHWLGMPLPAQSACYQFSSDSRPSTSPQSSGRLVRRFMGGAVELCRMTRVFTAPSMHSTTFHSSCIIDIVEARDSLAVTLAPRAITKVGAW